MIDTDKVGNILIECAEKYILPRYRQLAAHEINTKTGPRDLVTQADLDVEEHLKRVLPNMLPGSIVVGEEGVSKGTASLAPLQDKTQKIWVVDPVDGTHNFVHQKREFGIMLACIAGGRVEYAWIYDVLGKDMITAQHGGGVFSSISGRLRVRPVTSGLQDMSGHMNPHYFPKQYKEHLREARESVKSCVSLNCAAHEYIRILKGEAQFSIYSRMKSWDHLPGALMVAEAGGFVAKWDRKLYEPWDNDIGLIAAASAENWDEIYTLFLQKYL